MNEHIKEHLIETLRHISETIQHHPLMADFSDLLTVDFNIVGGAVRDYLLQKPIKDIDILISFNFYHNLVVDNPKLPTNKDDYDNYDFQCIVAEADALQTREIKITNIFKTPKYSFLNDKMTSDKLNAMDLLGFLTQHILLQSQYEIEKIYDKNTFNTNPTKKIPLKEHAYNNLGLSSIITLKGNSYPIELLLTPSTVQSFIRSFDFNICKVHMKHDCSIYKTVEFENDVKNKTITYTPTSDITQAKVEKSLLTRYPRFAKKYPDYTLALDNQSILYSSLKPLIEEHINSISLYHQLKKIPDKVLHKVSRKV